MANCTGLLFPSVANAPASTIDQVRDRASMCHCRISFFRADQVNMQSQYPSNTSHSPSNPVPAQVTVVEAADPQHQIQYLKNELKKAQALAALGELTSTATHEFNNVLMTIINYARLGIRNRDDASRDKALTKILEASERAAFAANARFNLCVIL